jgi:hypothetical protein
MTGVVLFDGMGALTVRLRLTLMTWCYRAGETKRVRTWRLPRCMTKPIYTRSSGRCKEIYSSWVYFQDIKWYYFYGIKSSLRQTLKHWVLGD